MRNLIYQKAGDLQRNRHLVTIRWIPGHSDIMGNEKADSAAKKRAQRGGKQAERWSSLAYIKKNLRKYGLKNSLSGTKPRHRREKPAAAVSMFLGQKTE